MVLRRSPAAVLAWLLLAGLCMGSAPPAAESPTLAPAYHLKRGSLARQRIVVLGRDLWVDGEAQSHAVAISGSVRVEGWVGGDIIVLDGDALLAETAEVLGDVFVLGGRIEAAAGAAVAGRSVAYPEATDLWVALIQGPTLGLSEFSPVVLGSRLALLAFWAAVVALLVAWAKREVLTTSESVRREPFHNFLVGMTAVLAMALTSLLFGILSGAFLGLPFLVLVVVIALVLRFWGMVAVFHALGEWLGRRFMPRPPVPIIAASIGLVALGILKFLPWIGIWSWTLATFIGVGAALNTKLGRREVFFEGL